MIPSLLNPFRFEIGPFWLLLPEHAEISSEVRRPEAWAVQTARTHWVALLGRFRLSIHLDPIQDLTDLRSFIEYTTKSEAVTPSIVVNEIAGLHLAIMAHQELGSTGGSRRATQ